MPQIRNIKLYAGLDLGQTQDHTAMAIIERTGKTKADYQYNCLHLQRWQRRTPYPDIVTETVKVMNSFEMHQGDGLPAIALDATGVGAPVIDLFKRERMRASVYSVQITGGVDETRENGTYRVPKRNLVSMVQVPLQQGRFKVASKLPEAATLVRELENFQIKPTDQNADTYGAWREGANDDLVLAVALALWSSSFGPAVFFSL